MSWDMRTRVVAASIVKQPVAGTFTAPNTTTNLIGIATPNNADTIIQAADPTMTGGVFEQPRVFLGRSSTAGGTIPLRGPGALVAADAWTPGLILQASGFAEVRTAADIAAVLQAGSTTTALVLDAGESAVDNFLFGMPIAHANIGAGFQQYSLIQAYVGASKLATIPETIAAPAGASAFTIPANLCYQLGTLAAAPPLLSISIWRDKKRYDYRDCRIQSLSIDIPVANETNQVFPSIDFTMKGIKVGEYDDVTPLLPQAIINVPVPAARGGKFVLDRVKLGHASFRAGINAQTAAASNQNQAAGQDGYTIVSAARTFQVDLNAMNVSDFDIDARIAAQTIMGMLDTWGATAWNRFGFLTPAIVLDPFNPGDRNGFVNLTGDMQAVNVDKSMSLAVW